MANIRKHNAVNLSESSQQIEKSDRQQKCNDNDLQKQYQILSQCKVTRFKQHIKNGS
jgi:anti-sigma28 factor (negative regulator of flagellin synthesis)